MAKLWAWGVGTAALIGLTIVGAGVCGANAHLVELSPSAGPGQGLDPACAPGPNYSAAVCLAAVAPADGPMESAGGDLTPADKTLAARGAPADAPVLAKLSPASSAAPAQAQTPAPSPSPPALAVADHAPMVMSRPGAVNASPGIPSQVRVALAAAGVEFPSHAHLRAAWDLPRLTADVERFRRSVQFSIPVNGLAKLIGAAHGFGDRARVYFFAGRGDRVMGFNMTHEPGGFVGLGGGGWSLEPAERVADAQVGVAWKRGQFSVALMDIQRKFTQFGMAVKDNLVGLHFAVTTGAKDRRAPEG